VNNAKGFRRLKVSCFSFLRTSPKIMPLAIKAIMLGEFAVFINYSWFVMHFRRCLSATMQYSSSTNSLCYFFRSAKSFSPANSNSNSIFYPLSKELLQTFTTQPQQLPSIAPQILFFLNNLTYFLKL
jgi:hypothetical protein